MSKRAAKRARALLLGLAAMSAASLVVMTGLNLAPPPDSLVPDGGQVERARLLARDYTPLTVTYANPYNVHDWVPLHAMPELLPQAFVAAEDQRFFSHYGVDWAARLHALWQNLRAGRAVRGASTITEQVVRIRHPRPRSLWARWLEGFDAARLERRFSKNALLEFYLNQVPYGARRRGVAQAARYYFGRSLDTLNAREQLTLAVLVRAPARYDVHRDARAADQAVAGLADRLFAQGHLSAAQRRAVASSRLAPASAATLLRAADFARFVRRHLHPGTPSVHTTLDRAVQQQGVAILSRRLEDLAQRNVRNGALLVVDHQHNEILAWAVAGTDPDTARIDAVTVRRQPGSTLKPFLYAVALQRGWHAAQLIDDQPLSEGVGSGLHAYRNYSRRHYGAVTLRDALGSSLNIPAVHTLQFVGVEAFLQALRQLGFASLAAHPEVYGDGLALGNGEVTLLELVGAYTALARGGLHAALRHRLDGAAPGHAVRVYSPEVASLIGNILSDPYARRLEFGRSSVLDLAVQTAVKTGTSTAHRDAWAVGFNHRYTAGVWMGNLDGEPMDGVTGSTGPALVLRALFAELNRSSEPRPLYLSPRLVDREVCIATGPQRCAQRRREWFVAGSTPAAALPAIDAPLRIRHPSPGLRLARDPRIPDAQEAFRFALTDVPGIDRVEWWLDGNLVATTSAKELLWPLAPGRHRLSARARYAHRGTWAETGSVSFLVK